MRVVLALAVGLCAGGADARQTLPERGIVTTESASGAATSWRVEIARTPAEQAIGLMNRPSMERGTGMLFDFAETRPVSMWMRNTLIPLDMVFLCPDGTIARVASAKPLDETIVPSGEPVRYVLEVNAGEASAAGLKRGGRLSFTIGGEAVPLAAQRGDCGR